MADMNKELSAMSAIAAQIDGLDHDERHRVLSWVGSKYNQSLGNAAQNLCSANPLTRILDERSDFGDFASFFNSASPKTENEKVLVAGYWFQKLQGAAYLESAALNAALTDLGHGISNIARTFDRLKAEKPALAMQTQKSGKSKQARKKYKITHEGLVSVERLMRNGGTVDESENS